MNSGKSDTLIKTAYNYTEQGLIVATIKPSVDTKGNRMIVARGGASREVDILAGPNDNLRLKIKKWRSRQDKPNLNCVLVDEAQFLTRQQIGQLYEVAKKMTYLLLHTA
jgi:thymidine kinase